MLQGHQQPNRTVVIHSKTYVCGKKLSSPKLYTCGGSSYTNIVEPDGKNKKKSVDEHGHAKKYTRMGNNAGHITSVKLLMCVPQALEIMERSVHQSHACPRQDFLRTQRQHSHFNIQIRETSRLQQ